MRVPWAQNTTFVLPKQSLCRFEPPMFGTLLQFQSRVPVGRHRRSRSVIAYSTTKLRKRSDRIGLLQKLTRDPQQSGSVSDLPDIRHHSSLSVLLYREQRLLPLQTPNTSNHNDAQVKRVKPNLDCRSERPTYAENKIPLIGPQDLITKRGQLEK
jgi:hypothetical protein